MKKDIKEETEHSSHPYGDEIRKFTGQTIEVKDIMGNIVRGKCLGIKMNHLNVVVDTGDDIVICKNIQSIRRNKKTKKK
jgi:hypothetical protein